MGNINSVLHPILQEILHHKSGAKNPSDKRATPSIRNSYVEERGDNLFLYFYRKKYWK